MADEAKGQVTFFSSASEPQSTRRVYERGGAIFLGDTAVLQTSDILIPGRHNVENYMAAIAAVDGYVDRENIEKVARRFPGVEHRIEFVKEIGASNSITAALIPALRARRRLFALFIRK